MCEASHQGKPTVQAGGKSEKQSDGDIKFTEKEKIEEESLQQLNDPSIERIY